LSTNYTEKDIAKIIGILLERKVQIKEKKLSFWKAMFSLNSNEKKEWLEDNIFLQNENDCHELDLQWIDFHEFPELLEVTKKSMREKNYENIQNTKQDNEI